jgi:hypothetical protein
VQWSWRAEKVGGKKVVVTRETEKKTMYTNASGINEGPFSID